MPHACRRDLKSKPGLPDTTCTCQRHKPVVRQQPTHVGNLSASADETRQLRRKVLRHNGGLGPQRWEFISEIGVTQLRDMFGAG